MAKFLVLTLLMALPWLSQSNEKQGNNSQDKFFKLPVIEQNVREEGNEISQFYQANMVKTISNPNFYPDRDWAYSDLEINSRAAFVVLKKSQKILYNKNEKNRLSIASLTKLLSAVAILDKLDLQERVSVTEKAVATIGEQGGLIVGENLSVQDLLFIMLIESSNDAAVQLEEVFNRQNDFKLVDTMNRIANRLKMDDSYFVNSTGLDLSEKDSGQFSTARDLFKLTAASLDRDLIWHILGLSEFRVVSKEGYVHILKNTNELLPVYREMIGGKTGYTNKAKGNFLSVMNSPSGNDQIIIIVLGSDDRFGDTKKIIDWIYKVYQW